MKTATEANDSTTVTNTLSVTKASAVAGYADTKYTLLGDKASVFGLNWDNYTDNKGIKTTEGANYGAKLDTITFTKVQHKKPFQLAEIAWTILLLYLNLLVQETTSIQLRALL